MAELQKGRAFTVYEKNVTLRQPFLDRARECAAVTIPYLLQQEGDSGSTDYQTPYESIGARGLSHLANKLMMAIFPPTHAFFRLTTEPVQEGQFDKAQLSKLEKALSELERQVTKSLEHDQVRTPIYTSLLLLLGTGNALLHKPRNSTGMRVFRMDRYVVVRDPMGQMLETCLKESVAPNQLDPKFIEMLEDANVRDSQESDKPLSEQKTIDLYTLIEKQGKKYKVYQEVKGYIVPDSTRTYPEDKLPWIILRGSHMDGEHYGRGYAEQYLGDLKSAYWLSKSLLDGAMAASRILFFQSPSAMNSAKQIEEAQNGAVLSGNANDITTFQIDKMSDFRFVQETLNSVTQRLAHAFLLNSAVTRNAERVTAEEIRFLVQELEASLGGLHSALSQELQLPLVRIQLANLASQGKIPDLPKELIKPSIITGVDALARSKDFDKLMQLTQALQPIWEAAMPRVNIDDYITRLATSIGIETDGLLKDEQQIQQEQAQAKQEQQQMAMQEAAMQSAPKVAQEVTKGMVAQNAPTE